MSSMTEEERQHRCEAVTKERLGQDASFVSISDWDRATHMNQQEWRNACLSSVKEDPTAFR
jgi:hypothetical protein